VGTRSKSVTEPLSVLRARLGNGEARASRAAGLDMASASTTTILQLGVETLGSSALIERLLPSAVGRMDIHEESALGCLPNTNSPMAEPPHREQPSFRQHDARRADAAETQGKRGGETVKPFCGRKRVQLSAGRGARGREGIDRRTVLELILQHIDERISHLPRASERSAMPTIRPKPAASKEHAIYAPRNPHHEPAHARRERGGAHRFND